MVMDPNQHAGAGQQQTNKMDIPPQSSANRAQMKMESSDFPQPAEGGGIPHRPIGSGYGDGSMMLPPNSSSEQSQYPQPMMQQPPAPQTANTQHSAATPTLNQLLTQNPSATPRYPSQGFGQGDFQASNPGQPPGNQHNMYEGWASQQQNANHPNMYPGQMRSGMPTNRPMAPHGMQMPAAGGSGMYDRPEQQSMPPNYRHANAHYGMGPAAGYRMMGPGGPNYPHHAMNSTMDGVQANTSDGSDSDMQHPTGPQSRPRPAMMGAGRMMGPPRLPGQMDPNGNPMMPPPNQNQAYPPGMHGYSGGGQPYRGQPMPPYANYQNNSINRMPSQGGYPPGSISQPQPMSPQVNGPQHKVMPPSTSQPMNQSSPAAGVRGLSPAPNQSNSLAPSPAPSTGQAKALSPCPSPSLSSHRSMPPSPSPSQQNINSPHPGLSPRPESVASPRTDLQVSSSANAMLPQTNTLTATPIPPSNMSQPASSHMSQSPANQQGLSQQIHVPPQQGQIPLSQPMQPSLNSHQPGMPGQSQTSVPHPHSMSISGAMQQPPQAVMSAAPNSMGIPGNMGTPQHSQPGVPPQHAMPGSQMMPQQPRMFPPSPQVGGSNPQMGAPQHQMPMGNGMPGYQQRMPAPGQPQQFQQQNRMPAPYPGGGQFPPNQQGFSQNNQGAWDPARQGPVGPGGGPAPVGMYPGKRENTSSTPGAVPSPLSAAVQSPAAGSPHGSESSSGGNRRPSNRKSDSTSSKPKANKPIPANTVHGTSMDVFNKQLELGPEPMRRPFLEHLLAFYLETAKPLMSNPSIGKNPFDLWKVYILTKEKGGFQEVCKKKLWKQIGSASSSSTAANAAYTLKKAYTKYLLNYECRYDRGGIDPQIVLSSVETKKDRSRNAPSPAGSSGNSQEAQMRGYPPGGDYNNMSAGGPGGHHPAPHMRQPNQYHPDPSMPQHQQQYGHMNFNNMGGPQGGMPNGHHPMHPQQTGSMPTPEDQNMPNQNEQNAFRQQQMGAQFNNQQQMSGPGYPPRHPYYGPRMPGPQRPPFNQHQQGMPGQQHPGSSGSQMMAQSNAVPQQGFGSPRPMPGFPNRQAGPLGTSSSNDYPGGYFPRPPQSTSSQYNQMKTMGPEGMPSSSGMVASNTPGGPTMGPFGPRPGYQRNTPRGALSAMLSNSAASSSSGEGALVSQAPAPGSFTESLAWGYEDMPPPPLPASVDQSSKSSHSSDGRSFSYNTPKQSGQWDRTKYAQSPYHADSHQKLRSLPSSVMKVVAPPPKKEITFPPGSVEAQQPVKLKRKVLNSKDIGKVDPWKLVMCLKSGLLCETIWALDAITILLHDDSSVMFFTLKKMPGLLDALLAHYKQSLALMFNELSDLVDIVPQCLNHSLDHDDQYLESKQLLLHNKPNYSWTARNGMKVIIDSDLKHGQMIPSPSMYNRTAYTCTQKDCNVVSILETDNKKEFYTKHCTKRLKVDKKRSQSITLSEDDITANSPVPASPTSGGTMTTESSAPTERRLIPEGSSVGQVPLCNGSCTFSQSSTATGDMKAEHMHSEHSCESSDAVMSTTSTAKSACESEIKKEPTTEQEAEYKQLDKSFELEALEAKLRLSRKRRFSENIDDEPVIRDASALECDVNDRMEEIGTRCVTLANIIRGLAFIPANEQILAGHKGLLDLFGKILKLRLNVDSRKDKRERWWPVLESLREHSLITLSNIAGHIQLIEVSHEICYPLMDSLLFWSTSTAAYARDGLANCRGDLSIQNLVMEILCKMCAHADNMNLLLATPPIHRITLLFSKLTKLLTETDQVRREFALVIVSTLAQADQVAARGLALQPACVSQLITILESAESAAFNIAQSRGVGALRQNPEAMGTSLDMIRRTSATLVEMAQVKENHSILMRQQDRLLNLVMSQILDQHVAKMLSDVLYECTKDTLCTLPASFIQSEDAADCDGGEMSEGEMEQCTSTSPTSTTDHTPADSQPKHTLHQLNNSEIPPHQLNSTPGSDSIAAGPAAAELDKENINKSMIGANSSSVEMISAAS